jgi:hypothetical protein
MRTIEVAMLLLLLAALSRFSSAETVVSVTVAPPVLPVYAQPAMPAPGYIWTPGYWAWGAAGYYWVPGTWVLPPAVGMLWTPGYWGWREGRYWWNAGYWGPRVGFYGGVNYGFGYAGVGFVGGYWSNGAFFYNRAVTNVNVNVVHNTYVTAVNNTTVNHVSFNGGPGGLRAQPTVAEREAMNERHVEATGPQLEHERGAAENRALLASENHGHPGIAATPGAGQFAHPGVVAARGNPAFRRARIEGGNAGLQERSTVPHHPMEGQPHPHAEGAGHPHGEHPAGHPPHDERR